MFRKAKPGHDDYWTQPNTLSGGKRRRLRATRKVRKGRKGKRTARKQHRRTKAKKSRRQSGGKLKRPYYPHPPFMGNRGGRRGVPRATRSRKHHKKGRSQRRRMRGGNVLANVPYTPSYSTGGIALGPKESALANPVPYTATDNCGSIPRS